MCQGGAGRGKYHSDSDIDLTLKNDKTLPIKSSNCGEEANLGR